jgi:transketolase
MRDTFAQAFYEEAHANPKLFLVVANISPASRIANFKEEFPTRFIDVGVAEQTMIGLAAGLALRGCKPFAYTISNFSIYRPFEQVRDDLCYQNLPVTVVGMGAGITYSPLGATHHTLEDVAVMSAIPNMSVLAPCDPLEVTEAVRVAARHPGPIYLRLGKSGEPTLTAQAPDPFRFGKIRQIQRGMDVAILAYGPITQMAASLAVALEREAGRSAALYSVHTLKPLDKEGIAAVLKRFPQVIVIEEHVAHGGLGAQVKQIAWESQAVCRLDTFALRDAFLHAYGSHDDVRRAHGLSVEQIYPVVASIGKVREGAL